MKNKVIITISICTLLIIIMIIFMNLPKKNSEVDTNTLNSGINNLLQDVPNEDVDIEIDTNSSSNSYEDYEPGDVPESSIIDKEIEDAQDFADAILNTSEDIIPKELNFSFYSVSSNVPEKITYHGCQFLVQPENFISTEISMINPSLYMTTVFPFYNDTEKEGFTEYYKTLMKGIIDDYGTVVAGENYEIFNIMDITEGFSGGMIFEFSDCYVLVKTMYTTETSLVNENNEKMNAIMVSIGYISKNEYHIYEGPEYISLSYIESFLSPNFKYYYYDADGKGYFIDPNNIGNQNMGMKY